MLRCPTCGRVYSDGNQAYCLNDGTALLSANPQPAPTAQFSAAPNHQPFPAVAQPAKKKSALPILIGVGVLMGVLFIGVLLIVGLILNFKKTGNPLETTNANAQPTPVGLVSPTEKYQSELKMAINSANDAQSAAYVTRNAAALRNYYSGEALKSFAEDVENLKRLKIYQVSLLKDQQFEDFKVNSAGTEAEVRVVETWETSIFQAANRKCLVYYPPTKLPQTVYLKKSSGGWMVDTVAHNNEIKRETAPCPAQKPKSAAR